jgi:hypothetical protein
MLCRMCRKDSLVQFLDMGFHPPSDEFRRADQLLEPVSYFPLEACQCSFCGLAQLSYVVSPEILYRHDYPYEASTTATGRKHFTLFAENVTRLLALKKDDLVVDIGSNVGVLLDAFKVQGMRVLGIEPAANIVLLALKRGIDTINEFISPSVAAQVVGSHGKAAVVTASNVFAHIDDLWSYMRAMDILLQDDGVFIFESPNLMDLVRNLEYDTIYHEHLSYLSLKPLRMFCQEQGFDVFRVEPQVIHGGSFRVFIGRKGRHAIDASVADYLRQEEVFGLYDIKTMRAFAARVENNRQQLLWMLRGIKHQGKTIAALSAPAKGMSLLNYCRLGKETLDFATEKSTLKIGRFTPGAHIPVLPDTELISRMPDYALLLAWNFSAEIMENLKEYRAKGGKFIIPIPEPTIVGYPKNPFKV